MSSRQSSLDAAWQEQIIQEWQHWRAFLSANQALLDARVADESAQFELTDTDAQEANARLVIQSLPPALRTRFENVLERYRREMQQQMDQDRRAQGMRGNADPDEVERETLAQLMRECEGLDTDDGLGRVPRDDGDWYGLDITSLLDVPADAYTIKGKVAPKQKQMALFAFGGVTLLAMLAFLLWPRSAPAAVIYSDVPLVNGAVATTWQPVNVSFTQEGSEGSAPASRLPATSSWPPAEPGEQALLWEPAVHPLEICLPLPTLDGLTEVTIHHAEQPARRYGVRESAQQADLVVYACGQNAPRYAVIQTTLPLATQPVGESVATDEQSIIVRGMVMQGRGQDPALPPDQARAVVTVSTEQMVDWPLWEPALTLESGEHLAPEQIIEREDHLYDLVYLIARPAAPIHVAWTITTEEAGKLRWRTTLDPPPTREAALADSLVVRVAAIDAGVVEHGDVPITLTLQLTNRGALPLLVQRDDLVLIRDERPQPLPIDNENLFRSPLQPDQQVTQMALLTVKPGNLTLRAGAVQYAFTIAATKGGGTGEE